METGSTCGQMLQFVHHQHVLLRQAQLVIIEHLFEYVLDAIVVNLVGINGPLREKMMEMGSNSVVLHLML